jgi:glycosyltransferase involved in cell wall biosynthesis
MIRNLQRKAMHAAYRILRYFYNPLRRIFGPTVLRHPRLHRFAVAIKEPLKELFRAPDVVSQDLLRTGSVLPGWLIEEWAGIHEIEPQLYPEKKLLETIPLYLYDMPDSLIGEHYPELCTLYGEAVSHVFLVPWLLTGGADLVTLNYVHALARENPPDTIAVITTLDAGSPWVRRLPHGTRFIEFGRTYSHLSGEEQEQLLARLFLQTAPRVIHNINSDLGYRIFVKYGKALSSVSDLYVSSFCIDVGPQGNSTGYPIWYLPKCFDYLKGLFSDNQAHLTRLREIFGFGAEIMRVHYQPIRLEQERTAGRRKDKGHLDILWAGRLDRQKRPDILISIAERCLGLPFRFHVYGSRVIDADDYIGAFRKLDNLTYHGAFDGLSSLSASEFDVFLYTSQWDGLPNILLEAISLDLPVIASNVGGVAELIADGKTGFLMDPYDDVDKYADCLRRISADRTLIGDVVANARAVVRERHSRERFIENVKGVSGYTCRRENTLRGGYA